MKKIGEGIHGTVYKKCNCYAVKESNENLSTEFRVQSAVHRVAPEGVVNARDFVNGKMYLNYINLHPINSKNFFKVVKKVLKTLMKIHKTYPSFRHNDLSMENVFVTKEGDAFIGDFGMANINRVGLKNPLVQSEQFKKKFGIFPKNDERFDIHFLLNSLYVSGPESLGKYITNLLPEEYLGVFTPKVSYGRLRAGVNHDNLPTMKQLFSAITINEHRTNLRKSAGQRKRRPSGNVPRRH